MKKAKPKATRSPHFKIILPQRFRHTKRTRSLVFSRFRYLRFAPFLIVVSLVGITARFHPEIDKSRTYLSQGVMSYATSVSPSGLLAQTNLQRSQNGLAGLGLNSKLNQAASTKAADMVARNYWSHTTPDGKEPWYFIAQAGYTYTAAGENLAYGFLTDSDFITGWMNSGPHRANVLGSGYTEVGFGIASSPDFAGHGPQTVVVALYAKPVISAAAVPSPVPSPVPAPVKTPAKATPAPTAAPTPAPVPAPVPVPQQTAQPAEKPLLKPTPLPAQASDAPERQVRKIQVITNGSAAWSVTAVVSTLCLIVTLWVLQRGLHFRRFIAKGEHYMLSHLHVDLTVAATAVLAWQLLQSVGAVR